MRNIYTFFLILIYFLLILPGHTFAAPSDDFVTTWKTDNAGTSNSTSITIPTTGAGYDYDVDWNNDGTFDETGLTGNVTHDFGSAGTYTIRIRGDFPRIFFNLGGDREKLLSVDQWGTIAWSSWESAFAGATNMTIEATDSPDLSSVTNMGYALRGTGITNEDLSDWDISNVTFMLGTFQDTDFNGDITTWDTSSVTYMASLFYNATEFNQDIGNWDTSNVETMSGMFAYASSFNKDIGGWDVGEVTNMATMFYNASDFSQDLDSWDVSKVTNVNSMFEGASSFNGSLLWGSKTGSITNMQGLFTNASSFNKDISGWDTSSVTNMIYLLSGATDFDQDLSSWDISSVTNMSYMFQGVTLSTSNYDAMLSAWADQSLQSNVSFHGGNSVYCTSSPNRASIISNYSWTIVDGGSCTFSVQYSAGSNGSISGSSSQTIAYGENSSAVTAVPDSVDYEFNNWSDGSTQNPRTDNNITSALSLIAYFSQRHSNSSSSIKYGCKDPEALNYDYFVSHENSLCKYENKYDNFSNLGNLNTLKTDSLNINLSKNKSVRLGDKGDNVKELQKLLNSNLTFEKRIIVDGIFGPQTRRAVREFQSKKGFIVDGIVGPQTWAGF